MVAIITTTTITKIVIIASLIITAITRRVWETPEILGHRFIQHPDRLLPPILDSKKVETMGNGRAEEPMHDACRSAALGRPRSILLHPFNTCLKAFSLKKDLARLNET